jgi:hypothetical protein
VTTATLGAKTITTTGQKTAGAKASRSPGLAIVSLAPHSINGHGKFPVRPVHAEGSDHFHRTWMSIIGISTSPNACHPDFGVPPTCPVDCHSDFVPTIIEIYDHFLYQYPCQPLLGSHSSAKRIPGRRKIVCECQQAFFINLGARAACSSILATRCSSSATRSRAMFHRDSCCFTIPSRTPWQTRPWHRCG